MSLVCAENIEAKVDSSASALFWQYPMSPSTVKQADCWDCCYLVQKATFRLSGAVGTQFNLRETYSVLLWFVSYGSMSSQMTHRWGAQSGPNWSETHLWIAGG